MAYNFNKKCDKTRSYYKSNDLSYTSIFFKNIFKSFQQRNSSVLVLKNLSFKLPKGKVISILGTSGAGKSTIARIINGLETYDQGTVFIEGNILNKASANLIRKYTAFVFQNFNLFPHMSVLENIIYVPLHVYKQNKNLVYVQAMKFIKQFNLQHKVNCLPGELSGGQKQRVAIIRALMLKPSILIMDEPTASLDPGLKHDLVEIVKSINKTGITVIIITHEVMVAKNVSDFILMLHAGRCVDFMPACDFFDDKKKKSFFSRRFLKNCE